MRINLVDYKDLVNRTETVGDFFFLYERQVKLRG